MPKLKEMLFGSSSKIKQLPNFSKPQERYQSELLKGARGLTPEMFELLQNILGGEEEAFESYEAPALRQFNEDIIPSILERFAGLGAQNSSGLQQTLGQAGSRLSENLAAQRANLQQSALDRLLDIGNRGLTPKSTPYIRQGNSGLVGSLSKGLGGALGGLLGGLF